MQKALAGVWLRGTDEKGWEHTQAHGNVETNSPFILRLARQLLGVALSVMPVRYALLVEADYARLRQLWLDENRTEFPPVLLQRSWGWSQV